MMRILAFGLLLLTCVPSPGQALTVDGWVTTDAPTNLTIDRSDGAHNVLHWQGPSGTDGRTLLGYYVYRVRGDNMYSPAAQYWVTGATSYTDTTANFNVNYVYTVTAFIQDAFGTKTESRQSVPAVAATSTGVVHTWPCQPVDSDTSGLPRVVALQAYPECLLEFLGP